MKFVYIAILLCSLLSLSKAEDGQCNEPIDKSAVTKEAADAAAKVIQNPPVVASEIYSSKVKSKLDS
jgi:hypothetical protein